jgi:hypothetical protein
MADHFLVIHLPGDLEPLERGEKYEDPLDEALDKAGKLGQCVGGGTAMVTEPKFRVTGCDIEVEVKRLDKALPVIRRVLEIGGAPIGTTITEPESETTLMRFTRSGVKVATPAPATRKKRFIDSCPWEVNEVVAYRRRTAQESLERSVPARPATSDPLADCIAQ